MVARAMRQLQMAGIKGVDTRVSSDTRTAPLGARVAPLRRYRQRGIGQPGP